MASVIEVTPRAPRLSMISGPMRFNKVVITVDGAEHVGAWDQPTRVEVSAGTHSVDVYVQALLSARNYVASMHVSVGADETARLEYRVPATLVGVLKHGFNKGSLETHTSGGASVTSTGTAASAPSRFCTNCGAPVLETAKFCSACGGKV